jgi:nucleotide-binding universal stress UspA family protein
MINQITCPTDFGPAATNATEYAARLSQAFHSKMNLLHQTALPAFSPILISAELIENQMHKNAIELNEICKAVSGSFHVPCTPMQNIGLFDELGVENLGAESNQLIVIGTNGADSISKYFFGSTSYHVVKNANCPVLVVPAGVPYARIHKIVFAINYDEKTKPLFIQLREFMRVFQPKITFLHVSEIYLEVGEKKEELGPDFFSILEADIIEEFGKENDFEFVHLYSKDVPESIYSFMKSSGAELLAISVHNQGLLNRFFRHPIARELTETSNYPLLVFHE